MTTPFAAAANEALEKRKSTTAQPGPIIADNPNMNDVLCDRGKLINDHTGGNVQLTNSDDIEGCSGSETCVERQTRLHEEARAYALSGTTKYANIMRKKQRLKNQNRSVVSKKIGRKRRRQEERNLRLENQKMRTGTMTIVAENNNVPITNKTNAAPMCTSIRIFRHELGVGTSSTSDVPSYTHSFHLVPYDLKDCHNGNDVLQKSMQLAQKYNSFLFVLDGELREKIRNNEKKIVYQFHPPNQLIDLTSFQLEALTIQEILTKGWGSIGEETVQQIEMTIQDVIQREEIIPQDSFIICV